MQKLILSRIGDYAIRKCNSADISAVISINMKTLPEHYSDSFYHEILSEFPETFLVAELQGETVAYIMCRIEYGFSHVRRFGLAKKGHIVSVAVLEEHRGKGIGSRLIEHVREEMRNKSCRECYLEVRASNMQAINLYERLNYKRTSRLEGYYRDGEPAYLMVASLHEA